MEDEDDEPEEDDEETLLSQDGDLKVSPCQSRTTPCDGGNEATFLNRKAMNTSTIAPTPSQPAAATRGT